MRVVRIDRVDRCYREIALTNRGVSMSADNETMNRSPINRDTEILPFDGNAIFLIRVARLIRYPPLPRFLPPPAHLIPSLCPEPATAGESWVNGNRSWCEFDSNRGGSRKTRFRRNGIHNRLETFSFDQIFDNSIEPISRNDYSLNI